MQFTIRTRLVFLGALVTVLVGLLIAGQIYVNRAVSHAADLVSRQVHDLQSLSELRNGTSEILLAAMDSIVDRDERAISPERWQAMTGGIAALVAAQADLDAMAVTVEERSIVTAIPQKLKQLERGVAELRRLIESGAEPDAFGAIDDALDEGGASVSADLGKLEAAVTQRADAAFSEQREAMDFARNAMLAAGVLGTLIVLLLIGATARSVLRPLTRLSGAISAIGEGKLHEPVEAASRQDELGGIARAVEAMRIGLTDAERLRAKQREEQERQLERGRRIEASVSGFERAIGDVVGVVSAASSELDATAQAMATTSEKTMQQAMSVASSAEQATANVHTVASATEELSASIAEIDRQVRATSQMIDTAAEEARSSSAEVEGLSAAAQRIGDVVKLINDIAGHTNLLALNATIEAARAGEAGRGFAVVAAEVKGLANQTAKATEEIAAQVRAIQDATAASARMIRGMSDTIGKVSETAGSIASAVGQQGAATREIALSVQQAAAGTGNVSTHISGVSAAARDTGAAAGGVLGSAAKLARNRDILTQQVDTFLREVRAA